MSIKKNRTHSGAPSGLPAQVRSKILRELARKRGERLREVRTLLNMTMEEFADLLGLHVASCSRYEQGYSCLPQTQAHWIQLAVAKKGLFVPNQWLLDGKGPSPLFMKNREFDMAGYIKKVIEERNRSDDVGALQEGMVLFIESEVFRDCNKDKGPIITMVKEDSMSPLLNKGDLVGGLTISPSEYHRLAGDVAIVDCLILRGNRIIRRVFWDNDKLILNSFNPTDKPEIIDVKEEGLVIAKVSWIRKMLDQSFYPNSVEEEIDIEEEDKREVRSI